MTDATVATIATRTGRTARRRGRCSPRAADRAADHREEVADAVWFCVDSAAVTGQGINVDGGAVQS